MIDSSVQLESHLCRGKDIGCVFDGNGILNNVYNKL